jgi:hypothetical protein
LKLTCRHKWVLDTWPKLRNKIIKTKRRFTSLLALIYRSDSTVMFTFVSDKQLINVHINYVSNFKKHPNKEMFVTKCTSINIFYECFIIIILWIFVRILYYNNIFWLWLKLIVLIILVSIIFFVKSFFCADEDTCIHLLLFLNFYSVINKIELSMYVPFIHDWFDEV